MLAQALGVGSAQRTDVVDARGVRVYYVRLLQMRCNKKGLVAPGSSEVITVDFHPRDHRYHYDCLRLHTDSENLLVPLHAYPVREKKLALVTNRRYAVGRPHGKGERFAGSADVPIL